MVRQEDKAKIRNVKVITSEECVPKHKLLVMDMWFKATKKRRRTTQVSRYQKGRTNMDFTEARDSEWQWHQLGHMQVCTSSREITTPAPQHSVFLQARCLSCYPTNSVKALKALSEKLPLNPIKFTCQQNICIQ